MIDQGLYLKFTSTTTFTLHIPGQCKKVFQQLLTQFIMNFKTKPRITRNLPQNRPRYILKFIVNSSSPFFPRLFFSKRHTSLSCPIFLKFEEILCTFSERKNMSDLCKDKSHKKESVVGFCAFVSSV